MTFKKGGGGEVPGKIVSMQKQQLFIIFKNVGASPPPRAMLIPLHHYNRMKD